MSRRVLLALTLAAALLEASGAAAQTRAWPSEGPPRPLAARPVKFPPYEIRSLPNGLQVVLVSHHEQPAVSVRMIVRAGAAQDPKGKLGVAMLTAALLDQGAGKRSAADIADAIDFVGGILGTGAGTDLTYINAVVMKDSLPLALELLADAVRRPLFAEQEIERQRQQALSGLKVAAEDPDNVASRVIDRLIYGFHPYGLPGSGTAESLTSLTRRDILDFHQQFFVPNNALLAIVGDVPADEAFAGVQKAFGDWQRREVTAFKPIEPPPPTRRVIVIDKPDAVQTEIRVGQLGIPRKHDEYVSLDQAVKILGGEGANRLQQVLRSQRGLTYGASADLDTYKAAGAIVAETDTRSSATAEVLRLMVDEFSRLQRERVHERELEGAQDYMAGHFPLTIETPDAIATQVLNNLFYELPLDDLQTYPERVRSVSPDDVQRVARSYLRPDRLSIVLVGNANAFINELRGIGFPEVERVPIEQLDLLSADFKRGGPRIGGAPGAAAGGGRPVGLAALRLAPSTAYAQTPAAQPASKADGGDAAQVKQVIDKAVEARGGLEAMKAIKTVTAEGTTTITTPNGKVSAKTRTLIEYPERIRVEATLPDAQIVQIYADGKAWLKDPGGVREAPPDALNDFRASVRRDPLQLLIALAEGRVTAKLLPEEGHQGRVLKVLALSGDGLPPLRAHFDPQTGLLVKLVVETRAPGQPQVATEELFDDYRKVGAVNIPFKASIVRDGMVVLERALSDVTVNTPLPAEAFSRPQ